VKYISPLSDDLEGNKAVSYPKQQNAPELIYGCISILTAVKILITLTFLGFGYSVFSITRVSVHSDMDHDKDGFITIIVGQGLSIFCDFIFLCVAIPYLSKSESLNDQDRLGLVSAVKWLVARDLFMHVGNGVGWLLIEITLNNTKSGVSQVIGHSFGFLGSLPLLL